VAKFAWSPVLVHWCMVQLDTVVIMFVWLLHSAIFALL
jgi:hypothetical protein